MRVEQSVTEVDGVTVVGTPKSHQCRTVPIPRSLVGAIAEACAGKQLGDLVFTARRGGVLMLRHRRRRAFDPAVTRAGLGELSPRELRHTAASLAVAAGADVEAVQRMLGYASAAMTLDVQSGLFDGELDAVPDRGPRRADGCTRSCGLPADRSRRIVRKRKAPTCISAGQGLVVGVELRQLEPLTPELYWIHGAGYPNGTILSLANELA